MKQFSVQAQDHCVIIDGEARAVDCSALDPTIQAIQWNEEKQRGHVEYVDEDLNDGQREPNLSINSIEPYQFLINGWIAAGITPE